MPTDNRRSPASKDGWPDDDVTHDEGGAEADELSTGELPMDGAAHSAGDEAAPPSIDEVDAETTDTAAASALARAREGARAKGFRPGSRPMRKRRPLGQSYSSADSGRDPSLLGDQMDRLLVDRGWKVDVAVGAVMGRWAAIVGADVAEHCKPVTFGDGVLTVRADSTAWATQLRLMSSSILGRLETEVGKDTVTELRVQGPGAPSWTRGLRKATGPGPRDTYG